MILIRADANGQIGSGHVMRCLSIAHALEEKGEKTVFISADHKADFLIQDYGFECVCLESNYAEMDEEDIEAILENYHPDLVLVDSYYVTGEYFRRLRSVTRVAYLDDLNRNCWDIDFLINYNVYAEVYDYSPYAGTRTELLLGPRYAPLRSEFFGAAPHVIREKVEDVLVSAGGSDPEGVSKRIMMEMCPKWPDTRFHILVGALNPWLEELRRFAGENVVFHFNEKDMAGLMKKCDVAISASGSTLYELCAMGVPTIIFTLADNQLPAAEQFERRNVMLSTGDCRGNAKLIPSLEEKLELLAMNAKIRKQFSERMQLLVDGLGAKRIVEKLLEKGSA